MWVLCSGSGFPGGGWHGDRSPGSRSRRPHPQTGGRQAHLLRGKVTLTSSYDFKRVKMNYEAAKKY